MRRTTLRLFLLTFTALALGCNLREKEEDIVAADPAEGGGVPAGVRIRLEIDRKECFLGENVLVHLVVENVGPETFHIDLGGDYRGSGRSLRFKVLATDEKGNEVPDPDPNPICMGGLSWGKEIKPGEKHYESIPIARYRRFEKAGTYRISVRHDFGWKEADDSKRPGGESTITFKMPSPEQAKEVVEEMYRLPTNGRGSSGQKSEAVADFKTLSYPVYLPVLTPRLAGGCEHALEAVGAMATPEATKELVKQLDNLNPEFAVKVLHTLGQRLPDPFLEEKVDPRYDYHHRRRSLVKRSWREEFAPAVRKVAVKMLAAKELPTQYRAASALYCLATADDLPALTTALGKVAERAKEPVGKDDPYPPPHVVCQELTRAASRVVRQKANVPEKPTKAGEMIVFACAVRESKTFRPEGWEKTLGTAMKHELPFVRETAAASLPHPVPEALMEPLAGLLADKNVQVQIAACRVVERSKVEKLRPDVLKVLRTAKADWLFDAANSAAHALGAESERMAILVERLDEEGMTSRCLQALTYMVLSDLTGYGCSTLDAAAGAKCKEVWEKFLQAHAVRLKEGKKFKRSDKDIPLKELFPGFDFSR